MGAVADLGHQAFLMLTSDLTVLWASAGVEHVLGFTPDEFVGMNVFDLLLPEDVAEVLPMATEVLASPDVHQDNPSASRGTELSLRVRTRDRGLTAVAVSGRVIDAARVMCVIRSDEERAALDDVLDQLSQGVELDEVLRSVVDLIASQFRAEAVDLIRRDGPILRVVGTASPVMSPAEAFAAAEGRTSAFVADSGVWIVPILERECSELRGVVAFRGDREGGPNPYDVLILHRATRLASLAFTRDDTNRQLRRAATEDHLTGLASRRGFDDEFDRLSSGDVDLPVALVFIDLDGFKLLNDRHGHDFGDAVLEAVGQRLQRAVRPGDIVARLGGDEFVVLAPGVSRAAAAVLERRVLTAVCGVVSARGTEAPIAASIGVAIADTVDQLGDLLRRADAEMYRNKQQNHRAGSMASSLGLHP